MAIILTLIGSLFLGLKTTYNALDVKKGKEKTQHLSPSFALGGSFLAAGLFLFILWIILFWFDKVTFPTTPAFWLPLSITVAINIFFEMLRFEAYKLTDLSLIAPFAGVAPLITIFTSWFILQEKPTLGASIGIFVIAASIYYLYTGKSIPDKSIARPFKKLWQNRGARLGFLSSIPPAFSIIFDKQAIQASHPITFSFIAFFLIGLGALSINRYKEKTIDLKKEWNFSHIKQFLKVGFFHFFAIGLFNTALLLGSVAYMSAVRRTSIVFEILFASLILREKKNMKKRLIVGIGVVSGVAIISIFRN